MVIKNFPSLTFDTENKWFQNIIPIIWLGYLPGYDNLGNNPAMFRGNDTTCLSLGRASGVDHRFTIQTICGRGFIYSCPHGYSSNSYRSMNNMVNANLG